jgi:hypothetical protein
VKNGSKKNLKPQSGNKNLAKRGQPKQKMEIKPGKKKNQMEDGSKTRQNKKNQLENGSKSLNQMEYGLLQCD